MDETNLRRWKVRDTLFSPWRELPGRYTAEEMWVRRRNSEFKVAVPIVESDYSASSKVAKFRVVALGELGVTRPAELSGSQALSRER